MQPTRTHTGPPLVYPTLFATLCATLALFFVALNGVLRTPYSTPVKLVESPSFQPASPPPQAANPTSETRIRLAFAGDIMQHREQMNDNFFGAYEPLRPLLSGADLAVGNLEFPVYPERPIGPPPVSVRFNGSPAHLEALASAGFDVLVTANNHAFDQGLDGALKTLEQIKKAGMRAVGTGASRERAGPLVLDVKGIPVAIAAYTFRPNSYPDDKGEIAYWDRTWPIQELNFQDWTGEYREEGQRIFREHADLARREGARVLVAYVHWGEEWHFHPTEHQRLAGRDMIDAGFDLVIGSHSHVLNPAEVYRGRLIAYSLGNIMSAFEPVEVRTAAVLEVDMGVPPSGASRLRGFRFLPTMTERADTPNASVRVGPLSDTDAVEHRRAMNLVRRILGDGAVTMWSGKHGDNKER